MILVNQSWGWEQKPKNVLETLEKAGRICYKSEEKITEYSSKRFVRMIVKSGHHSVIEHMAASVKIICDTGISHEIVRHRLCSFSQESTRWCNYGSGHIKFIIPPWFHLREGQFDISMLSKYENSARVWLEAMLSAERDYQTLIKLGQSPQQARSVLPKSLKTELVMTANLREWIYIFKLRTKKDNHPQMQLLMKSILEGFRQEVPILFDDI